MKPKDCVFVIYENYFGICTKAEWNRRGGYVDDHSASPQMTAMIKNISPLFEQSAESMWSYRGRFKKYIKEGRQLLLNAGLTESNLGQRVK